MTPNSRRENWTDKTTPDDDIHVSCKTLAAFEGSSWWTVVSWNCRSSWSDTSTWRAVVSATTNGRKKYQECQQTGDGVVSGTRWLVCTGQLFCYLALKHGAVGYSQFELVPAASSRGPLLHANEPSKIDRNIDSDVLFSFYLAICEYSQRAN